MTKQHKMRPIALVVEDNSDVIFYLQHILKKDYRLVIGRNGREGIDKAFETIPDIIISDVMMPESDGYTLCDTLKSDSRTSHIPIILLTARGDTESRLSGLKKGADVYLSKPFHREELALRMKKLIEGRKAIRNYFQQLNVNGSESIEAPQELEALPMEVAFLREAKTAIIDQLDNSDFGVPELADVMALSRSQLYRKLHALTSETPSYFIRTVRLQQAKILLDDQSYSITDIAYMVGFSDPAYFSRVYREKYGKSPSEDRKVY